MMSGMSNQAWRPHAVPGSIKPVYGAQYPPPSSTTPYVQSGSGSLSSVNSSGDPAAYAASMHLRTGPFSPQKKVPVQAQQKFAKFQASVSDAWDADEEDASLINARTAHLAADEVLARHASLASSSGPESTMVNLHSMPSRYSKVQAMQRLATQREPLPGSAVAVSHQSAGSGPPGFHQPILYPKLPDLDCGPSPSSSGLSPSSSSSATKQGLVGNKRHSKEFSESPVSSKGVQRSNSDTGGDRHKSTDRIRYERLKAFLDSSATGTMDLTALRGECWKGIPHKLRPTLWRLLSGYLPSNAERREETLRRKREEYFHYVEQYFHTRHDEQHQDTFRQIHIDIPRMCPLIPLFQQKLVQEIFERILYIWAIRHPASGYVQGINDLVTPFFVVFLSEFVRDDLEVGTCDVERMERESLEIVEADSFWCVSSLLDSIQDNYTFAQPGIQRKVKQLQDLMTRVDSNLHHHLIGNEVDYLQFSFRWMNNLLMREIPLRATIRLWDTYLSELNGFSEFHVYTCAAFLRMWSRQLQQQRDFQNCMLFLQNLPTHGWTDKEVCELTADAYSLMCLFAGAKNHLTS